MRLLEEFLLDARYALRGMRRAPGFTSVAVLTLALGIGANTAIFSVLYGVWLAPPRYPHADRLVDIARQQLTGKRFLAGTSYLDLEDWKAQMRSVEALGVHRFVFQMNVTGAEGAEEVIAHRVSGSLFGVLGVRPRLGRGIDSGADRGVGPREALISYAWWQRRFGGDSGVVGRPVQLDGEEFTIVGVMPRGFEFPPMTPVAYRPVIWPSLNLPADLERARDSHPLEVVARLKPGVSIRQSQAEMDAIAGRLAIAYPAEEGGWGITVSRLTDVRQLADIRPALLLVMVAASLVLLIACANIANLLVARAAGREREIAVRRALGVTRLRLARQLLTESGVLALCGGAAGLLLAYAGLPLLKSVMPAQMPRADEIELNGAVLWFAAAASITTGILFGMIPAVAPGGKFGLRSGVRLISARNRAARVLVTLEVALSLVLLASAGLLLESFRKAANVDLGFRKEHTLTMRLQLTKRAYPNGQRVRAFREELLRRVEALPGVQIAGTVSSLPMGIIMQGTDFTIEGRPETAGEKPFASYSNVSTDYLRAIGVPLVAGRYFSETDGPTAPPVTIISESLARTWWNGNSALGARIRFDDTSFTIVGIAKDVRQNSPEKEATGQIYALNHQLPSTSQAAAMGRFNVVVIRTQSDPTMMARALRRVVADVDKNQPVAEIATMERVVERQLASRRLNTLLLGMFAGLAVLLAVIGVFGVASYTVARRTKEIGIRMALGATPSAVLGMTVRETLVLAIAGAAIGLGGTVAASRVLARFLFGVRPVEPAIIGAMAMALVAVVVGSGMIPARRAMRVDPAVALREE